MNYPFVILKMAVFRTTTGTAGVTTNNDPRRKST